jgi:hypothetical protein
MRGYSLCVGIFKWLYRLPGRINRSFGPTVAATNVERGVGMGGVGADPAAVSIVAEEIKGSTGSDEGDYQDNSPSSD